MSSRVITGYKVNKRGRRVPIYGTSNSADEVKKAETKSTVTESAETIKDKKNKQKKTILRQSLKKIKKDFILTSNKIIRMICHCPLAVLFQVVNLKFHQGDT